MMCSFWQFKNHENPKTNEVGP